MTSHLTIALAGDVMLGRNVNRAMAQRGPLYPWGDLRPELEGPDAVLINLECALTPRHEEWTNGARKAFYFRADPDTAIPCLRAGNIALTSLANNHAGDYGPGGLLDTVAALDKAGIGHAGAGRNLSEAAKPARLTIAGTRIAVVAFADHPAAWAATPSVPGIHYLPDLASRETLATVRESIAAARTGADLVVCSLHWGPNMRPRPTREFRDVAHRVIEAGADVLFGHSAHVVQGIEIFRGKPILHDTGDFVDDYAVDEVLRNDLSALFLLHISQPPGIDRLELVPGRIDHCQVNLATGQDRALFAARIARLCAELGTEIRDNGERLEVALPGTAPS